MTSQHSPTTRDRGALGGPGSIPAPTWATPANSAHGRAVGGSSGDESDVHDRFSAAHVRLAELHTEIATIHRELAEVQLDESANSRLMLPVPEATKTRPLLSVRDVAKLLHVDPKTVRNLRDQQNLPAAVKFGGVVRWCPDDIDGWIEEQREASR